MSSADGQSSGVTVVVLRDLESLLRQSLGNEVQVVDYSTSLLVPPGENYASTMLKVEAVIKRRKNAEEERLALVAKMIPSTEMQQNMMDGTASFRKEIFVFEQLIKTYRQVGQEAGLKPNDLIDILPKYYGGRFSLSQGAKEIDKDAVLLMENLNLRGYFTKKRNVGLELEHAKMAITELARYHALGMATKQRRAAFFEDAKKQIDVFPFKIVEEEWSMMITPLVDTVCSDPRIAKFGDRIRTAILSKTWDAMVNIEAVEPWVTIIHGDFWVNNMMFREVDGKPSSVKFVDFQLARACSPMKDLPYFLCTSTTMDVMDNHFEQLLTTYHEKFIENLKKLGCDTKPFSRDAFDKQLKKDASDELFRCLMALKVFTLDVPEDLDLNDMKSSIFLNEGSDLFKERAWRIVSKFVEKEWI